MMEAHIPSLSEIARLPRWAKVMFMSRCAMRVAPLIQAQWTDLSSGDRQMVFAAGANADASARLGQEVHVFADMIPQLMGLVQEAEDQGNMAAYGLVVSATAAALPQITDAQAATMRVGTGLEHMIRCFGASGLNEGAVIGSVWDDYVALQDAAQAGGWNDETAVPADDVLGDLWPNGTPPGWPE